MMKHKALKTKEWRDSPDEKEGAMSADISVLFI